MAKRCFDIFISSILLMILAPLMLAIAIIVRVDTQGPVVFQQVRVGRFGRNFVLWKFRTMVSTPRPVGSLVTASGDPRITQSGRWLRGSKLDELPQLVNVLLGDMSLVGPRPEVPQFVAMYSVEQRDRVLSLRPGVTDEAAIRFRDEEKLLAGHEDPEAYYIEAILPQKLACYEAYARGRSFRGDLGILFRTLLALLK